MSVESEIIWMRLMVQIQREQSAIDQAGSPRCGRSCGELVFPPDAIERYLNGPGV